MDNESTPTYQVAYKVKVIDAQSRAGASWFGILKGMFVTLYHFFKTWFSGAYTVQYPEERVPLPTYYRGRHQLNRDENGLELCVGCFLCSAACPTKCINIEARENEPGATFSKGERYAEVYEINMGKCIFCGLCVDACPTGALTMSPTYELADYDLRKLIYNKEKMLVPGPDLPFNLRKRTLPMRPHEPIPGSLHPHP